MVDTHNYLDPQTLSKLNGLELRARHVVEGFVAGTHRSPYHGFSVEFAEHREYTPGDDLRYVDWKVYGKTDKIYLKQFEEETNLVSYLALDTSASMRYQGPVAALSKIEYARCAAASLAYLVLHQQDSVGLATFNDQIRAMVRPSGNPSHLKQLLHTMEESVPEHKTSTGAILHDLAERLTHRGIVVLISDLLDDVSSIVSGLQHLRYRRHDVVVLHVLDPAEVDFPFEGPTRFHGLEQAGHVLTDPQSLRAGYLRELREYLKAIRTGCRGLQADYLLIRTDQPLDVVLAGYLAARMKRHR
ncbi:MAG: DUF58 domain-containing protein [Pirellulales bacterium]